MRNPDGVLAEVHQQRRSLIHAATDKSEAFNGFLQWVAFAGDGTISTNGRNEQRKMIKYNHLVANCIIFHNVYIEAPHSKN